MPSIMNYSFKVIDPAVVFGNAYDSAKVVSINLNSGPTDSGWKTQQSGTNFLGNLQGLRIQGTASYTLAGGDRAAIEVKGYRDAEGTELILVPTTGLVHEDVTGGKHTACYSLDLVINLAPADELFLFIKTQVVKPSGNIVDGGASDTFSVSELEVTNRRN